MIDLLSILSQIDSSLQHFDHIFDIYNSSLYDFYNFTNENIDQVNVTGQDANYRVHSVVPLDPSENATKLAKIYTTRADSVSELRIMLEAEVAQTLDIVTELNSNSDNYNQIDRQTIDSYNHAFNERVDKLNDSISHHRDVM